MPVETFTVRLRRGPGHSARGPCTGTPRCRGPETPKPAVGPQGQPDGRSNCWRLSCHFFPRFLTLETSYLKSRFIEGKKKKKQILSLFKNSVVFCCPDFTKGSRSNVIRQSRDRGGGVGGQGRGAKSAKRQRVSATTQDATSSAA